MTLPTFASRAVTWLGVGGVAASVLAFAPATETASPATAVDPVADATVVDPAPDTADRVVAMGAVDPEAEDPTAPPATEGRTDRFEYLAYYPSTLEVHRGDVVWFDRRGFHTVSFTPPDEARVPLWRQDETEGVAAIDGMDPSQDDCGGGEEPCTFSGDERFNSGWGSMAVEIDAPVGTYDYYCAVHAGMKGTIEVVEDDEPVASPDAVEEVRQDAIAADTAAGEALIAANQTPEFEQVGDHRRWFVKAGDITEDGRVAVVRFMPSQIEIAPGDEIEYVASGVDVPGPGMDEISAESHTVTFPNDPANSTLGIARYLLGACDPDDPSAGIQGAPVWPVGLLTGDCPGDLTFELLVTPNAWQEPSRPPQDVVVPGSAYDSGLMVPEGTPCRIGCDPWTEEPFPSTTPAKFPAEGTYGYVCLVHPTYGMSGGIVVTSQ